MLEPRPLARKSDVETSHEAAKLAKSFAAKHESAIYAALHESGFLGLTSKEVADRTGLSDVQVSRRTAGMSTQKRPLIKRSGEVRERCCVWVTA